MGRKDVGVWELSMNNSSLDLRLLNKLWSKSTQGELLESVISLGAKNKGNLRCLKSAFLALSVLPVTPMPLWTRSGHMWTSNAGMSQSVWFWIIASGWHFIWDTSVRGVVALNSLHHWWDESCFQREGQISCSCVWRCFSFGVSRTRLRVHLIGASAHSQVWTSSLCAHKLAKSWDLRREGCALFSETSFGTQKPGKNNEAGTSS